MSSRPRPATAGLPSVRSWPSRKPMATCRRVSLYQREIRLAPSAAAFELLIGRAARLSEGGPEGAGWLGSTMLTFDLERAAHLISDPCDAATARRLAELAGKDERVKAGARAVALEAARTAAGAALRGAGFDVRVRSVGPHVHVDVDVEGQLTSAREP